MKTPKPPAATPKSRTLITQAEPGKSDDDRMAQLATAASVPVALIITDFGKGYLGELSLTSVLESLKEHASTIKGGDLTRIEAMLGGQAAALNTMFAELARRGALNMGEHIGAAETYLKLALRSQSQCRATLETLAAIKNPPIVFANQANIANGPQQINNEVAGRARVQEIKKQPTELLEHDHGQGLDSGTAAAASGSDQAMAALEAIHRPPYRSRKGGRQP